MIFYVLSPFFTFVSVYEIYFSLWHFTIGINGTVPRNIFQLLKKRISKDISAQFHLPLFIREML
jgi:hypothetical protein